MNDIDGSILAGGSSTRMGRDKADLCLSGKTFVERSAAALSAVATERLFIVGNLKKGACGLLVVPDEYVGKSDERRAAIIGLHAALSKTNAKWTAVLACDLPFASGDLFLRLASFRDENFDAVVPIQADGRSQPLCALYRRQTCLPVVEAILGGNDWSLRKLLRSLNTRFVCFDEISDLPNAEHFFLNVNTPEDHSAAIAIETDLARRDP